MCALTLLATPIPATASGEEQEAHQYFMSRLLPFLQAFLPTPWGIVPPLQKTCIDILLTHRQQIEGESGKELATTGPSATGAKGDRNATTGIAGQR